jgi:hypothetical protein
VTAHCRVRSATGDEVEVEQLVTSRCRTASLSLSAGLSVETRSEERVGPLYREHAGDSLAAGV